MSTILIEPQPDDISIELIADGSGGVTVEEVPLIELEIASMVVGTSTDPKDLISKDTPNDLFLGSDHKLVSQPQDFDLLAYYLLA